jgi:hypothetical protein
MVVVFGALGSLGSGACGGDDAPSDGPFTIDIDNASCGDRINFTGEYVDWDNDTTFCGINDALFQVQGDGPQDGTAPNGRFQSICISDQAVVLLDVTPPPGNSTCTSPPATYTIPGIAVANRDVILSGAFYSVRSFTTVRRDNFFATAGFSFAPALAQVYVHVHGTPRPVSITAQHAPTQAVSDKAWAPGDTGHEVFFPNVDVGSGTTTLTVMGGAIGTGTIPLVGGKITYVTVHAR